MLSFDATGIRLADSEIMASREVEAADRSNLIIAVGDLALRFPNLLEPWTSHIYQPLSDPDIGASQPALSACILTSHDTHHRHLDSKT